MTIPAKRRTKSSKRQRAAHFAIKKRLLPKCANCQQPKMSHRVCANCGFYGGRQIIDLTPKTKTKPLSPKS